MVEPPQVRWNRMFVGAPILESVADLMRPICTTRVVWCEKCVDPTLIFTLLMTNDFLMCR